MFACCGGPAMIYRSTFELILYLYITPSVLFIFVVKDYLQAKKRRLRKMSDGVKLRRGV